MTTPTTSTPMTAPATVPAAVPPGPLGVPAAPAPDSALVKVWKAEVTRLDKMLPQPDPVTKQLVDTMLQQLQAGQDAAQKALTQDTADLAKLRQTASTLQQQLAAATTGPERREKAANLDDNLVQQDAAIVTLLTDTEKLAIAQRKVLRHITVTAQAQSDRAAAQQALAQAGADAAADDKRVTGLPSAVTAAQTTAAGLSTQITEARTNLEAKLGGVAITNTVAQRVCDERTVEQKRSDALNAAVTVVNTSISTRAPLDSAVQLGADALADARSKADQALGDLATVTAAATVLGSDGGVLSTVEQADIATAAQAVAAASDATRPEAYARWVITLPAWLVTYALALLSAEGDLLDVTTRKATDLIKGLQKANDDYAAAVGALLHDQLVQGRAAGKVTEVQDALDAYQPTLAQRRATVLLGGD